MLTDGKKKYRIKHRSNLFGDKIILQRRGENLFGPSWFTHSTFRGKNRYEELKQYLSVAGISNE